MLWEESQYCRTAHTEGIFFFFNYVSATIPDTTQTFN